MSLLTPIYWLKAVSGAGSPVNEVTGTGALSGGTIALTEITTGVFAWRFTGSNSTATHASTTIDSSGVWQAPGDGPITWAVRMAINTMPTGSGAYPRLVGFSSTTDLTTTGTNVLRNASDTSYAARAPNTGDEAVIGSALAVGSTLKTVVIKMTPGTSGNPDTLQVWVETVGRVGSTRDYQGTGANYAESVMALDNAIVQPGNGTLDVADLVLWDEGLSDADCAAAADDLRTAMSAPAPTVTTQPSSSTVTEGAAATFTGVFANTPTSYSWEYATSPYSSWSAVSGGSGSTTASYTTAATSLSDSGRRYRCTATNAGGSVTTNGAAELTVNPAGSSSIAAKAAYYRMMQ